MSKIERSLESKQLGGSSQFIIHRVGVWGGNRGEFGGDLGGTWGEIGGDCPRGVVYRELRVMICAYGTNEIM